jgi:hypothetical protein
VIVEILGRKFDTYSEEWRHQCEVNYVFPMSPGRRRIYLSSFHDHARRDRIAADLAATTPEFVIECRALQVARMRTRNARHQFMLDVEYRDGKLAADQLRARAIVLWKEIQDARNQVDR